MTEYVKNLQESLDELESSVGECVEFVKSYGTYAAEELQKKISDMTSEIDVLNEGMRQAKDKCAEWEKVCKNVVYELDNSIETVKSLLTEEK